MEAGGSEIPDRPTRSLFIEVEPITRDFRGNKIKLWKDRLNENDAIIHTSDLDLDNLQYSLQRLNERLDPGIMRQVGHFLYDFLPDPVRRIIQYGCDEARAGQYNLKIKIVTNSPGSIDLPWELLCDNSGRFMTLDASISILRYIPISVTYAPLFLEPPLKILFVLTNPKDENIMRSNEELDAIACEIERENDSTNIQTTALLEPTLGAFVKELQNRKYHVIHYIGHGGIARGEGNLILHGPSHRTYWLSAIELSRILPTSVKLLCLSSCFTAKNYQIQAFNKIGQTARQYDLPTMVVNQFPLSPNGESVKAFWGRFYKSLYHEGAIDKAITEGRLAVDQSQSQHDWASFVLHSRYGTEQLFLPISQSQVFSTRRINIVKDLTENEKSQLDGLETQISVVTKSLNDLKNQASTFAKPPIGLQKAIEGTEKIHKEIRTKYDNLTGSRGVDSVNSYEYDRG